MKYRYPVIAGFHPAPSVCRVGEDYHLAGAILDGLSLTPTDGGLVIPRRRVSALEGHVAADPTRFSRFLEDLNFV